MPEIPEIEAFKEFINIHCLNKEIIEIKIFIKKIIQDESINSFKKLLIGNKFIQEERKGKYLIINLNKFNKKLIMHFGLTGALAYEKNSNQIVRFSCIQFIFKDNSSLYFLDQRKFGKVWIVNNIESIKSIKNLGPDPLKLTEKQFIDLLKKNINKNIKTFFMDQNIISGIGNEYSDEILFQASIDPHHKIKDLNEDQMKNIYKKMIKVLKYFINFRIKKIKKDVLTYFSNEDRKTFKSSYLQAHRHINMICPKNKNHELKKITISGRTTYYCPIDQK